MDGTIADHQRTLLKDWANDSQVAKSSGKPQISKRFLKQEFEKLKPQIIMKLEKQA